MTGEEFRCEVNPGPDPCRGCKMATSCVAALKTKIEDLTKERDFYHHALEAALKERDFYLNTLAAVKRQDEAAPENGGVWEPVGDLGDVMPLSEWVGEVIHGGFIDYDGYGHYVRDGKMRTDIVVVPSMLKNDEIDHSFDQIIWFNR